MVELKKQKKSRFQVALDKDGELVDIELSNKFGLFTCPNCHKSMIPTFDEKTHSYYFKHVVENHECYPDDALLSKVIGKNILEGFETSKNSKIGYKISAISSFFDTEMSFNLHSYVTELKMNEEIKVLKRTPYITMFRDDGRIVGGIEIVKDSEDIDELKKIYSSEGFLLLTIYPSWDMIYKIKNGFCSESISVWWVLKHKFLKKYKTAPATPKKNKKNNDILTTDIAVQKKTEDFETEKPKEAETKAAVPKRTFNLFRKIGDFFLESSEEKKSPTEPENASNNENDGTAMTEKTFIDERFLSARSEFAKIIPGDDAIIANDSLNSKEGVNIIDSYIYIYECPTCKTFGTIFVTYEPVTIDSKGIRGLRFVLDKWLIKLDFINGKISNICSNCDTEITNEKIEESIDNMIMIDHRKLYYNKKKNLWYVSSQLKLE